MDVESLIKFFADELDLDTRDIAEDTLLFSSGIIDSFALVSMMMFVESKAGIRISPADVRLDNFDSIERIIAFVEQLQSRN